LVYNYFEQVEYEEPIKFLKDAGVEVIVISASQKDLQSLHHARTGDKFRADLLLNQTSSEDYDALVLPGGVINADSLRSNETAQRWLLDFLDSGRPIAAICHAPWLLVSADAVEGKRLTSYYTIKDDIINSGGEWVNLPVVVDDNLITCRHLDDIPKFNEAIINMLGNKSPDSIKIS